MANPVDKEEDAPHKREETMEISPARMSEMPPLLRCAAPDTLKP